MSTKVPFYVNRVAEYTGSLEMLMVGWNTLYTVRFASFELVLCPVNPSRSMPAKRNSSFLASNSVIKGSSPMEVANRQALRTEKQLRDTRNDR
jgi:hypothetical protein